jgi:nucleoside-diphosphate-sugar epimerase
MPVWMVTGATGFLGRHVLSTLATRVDARVVALGRRRHEPWDSGEFVTADLDDLPALTRAVAAIQPDCVIHAAGRTPPDTAESFYRSNTLATLYLLEALKALGRPVRVVLAGSAAELGPVSVADLPVGEDQECHPHEAYGLSKWLATCAGLAARPPVEVMVGRIFNPIGPGLSTSQAFGRFAAELADPSTSALVVGDLEARRDFIDIRDVAQALVALAEQGRSGRIYHIGTGRSLRVGDGLDRLLQRCGRKVSTHVNLAWLNPDAPRDSRADVRRIESETGWRASIGWEQSLDDLWDEAKRCAGLRLTT